MTVFAAKSAAEQWVSYLSTWGTIGVDLFLVLSGYLITSILLESKGREGYFKSFYGRRVLRIFPLYYAVLFAALVILPRFLPPDRAARFGQIQGDEVYYWTYLQNFAIARAGTWRHGVLDITWSLAIEEQFYLLWPTIVLLCSPRSLGRVAVALFVGSLGFRVVGQLVFGMTPFAAYVLTPCRLDGLAAGTLVAVLARRPGGLAPLVPRARLVALGAGIVALGVVVAERLAGRAFDDGAGEGKVSTLVGYSLVAAAAGGLLVMVVEAREGSLLHRVFASRALRFLGTYSYGLYLIHLPIRALIRDRVYGPRWVNPPRAFLEIAGSELPGQLLFTAGCVALVSVAAWVVYHLYERWFLRLKRFFPTGAQRAPVAAGASGSEVGAGGGEAGGGAFAERKNGSQT